MALDHYTELPKSISRYVKTGASGTLLSLILFEKGFCNALWQLGFDDAMAKQAEIRRFFRLDDASAAAQPASSAGL